MGNRSKKILKLFLVFVVTTVGIYFAIALGLILSQSPGGPIKGGTLAFQSVPAPGPDVTYKNTTYKARDGAELKVRQFAAIAPDAPLIIVIHGSGWHGGSYIGLGQNLSQGGANEVLVPDLRGHGEKPLERGDVSYIGQLEEDLADLIDANGGENRRVILFGHSSGGGLVIRFAGSEYGMLMDQAVLLAPFLKHDAPTTRVNAGGWAHALTRRIIGLVMLNGVGFTGLNGLTAVEFNFPDSVLNSPQGHSATTHYSFRMNSSYAPRFDYLADIAALPEFLLVVGSQDEAFHATLYEKVMAPVNSKGRYAILPGLDHLGVIADQRSSAAILKFLD